MFGCDSDATAWASRSKPPPQLGIARKPLGQHLHRHLAPEPRVRRPIDFAHAARAQRSSDLVGTELSACCEHGARLSMRSHGKWTLAL